MEIEKILKPVKVSRILMPKKVLRERNDLLNTSPLQIVLRLKVPKKYGKHLLPIEQDYKRPDSPDPRTKLYSCNTLRGRVNYRIKCAKLPEEKLLDYPCSPKNWLNGRFKPISLSLPDW